MPFSSVLGASSVIKPGVCTSTTRPTVPYEGQLIYETDTDRVAAYNGSAWIDFDIGWTSYTPTWTNLTVGNATQSWKYAQHGKIVFVTGRLTWGSTTSASGAFIMSLPVTTNTTQSSWFAGNANALDMGTENYHGNVVRDSTTTVGLRVFRVTGTLIKSDPMTSTVPMTWVNTDVISATFYYEAA